MTIANEVDEVVSRIAALEAENEALRENRQQYEWMQRNWFRTLDTVSNAVFSAPITVNMTQLNSIVTAAIDSARKESGNG